MSAEITPRLALRALNDSRKVDPIAYLSLRYTLASVTSLKNVWASTVAPEIVRRRPGFGLLKSKLFKQFNQNDEHEFREVFRAGGPEVLAEIALLDACSKAGKAFQPADEVYSYHFAKRSSVEGAFMPYFELFRDRQAKIGETCEKRPGDWVLYADIKQFYPSITSTRALKAWNRACEESELPSHWGDFGRLLLSRQYSHQHSRKKGLLIGPSFSHLIANLVLRDLDNKMARKFPGRYFRYVDDFALIVPPRRKHETESFLRAQLKPLGLRLNRTKIHWIGTEKWRLNAPYQMNDYDDDAIGDEAWMHFIDHLKCYLMGRPAMLDRVRKTFVQAGLRVPLPRYTSEMMAKGYGDRFRRRIGSEKFVEQVKKLNPTELKNEGLRLRKTYTKQFGFAWEEFMDAKGPIRKWKLSKVRYLLGRMLLIGSIDQVSDIHGIISEQPEVAEYTAMFTVLLTRNANSVLKFGWKIAASVGQVLAAASIQVSCKSIGWDDEHVEAYTALRLAGVEVEVTLPRLLDTNLRIQTVKGGRQAAAWTEIEDPFYREMSALMGSGTIEKHQALLQTPADPDERWEVFADELLGLDPT